MESNIGPLGQALFRVAAVPARAAYLIDARSSTGLRRAIQEASTRWAGATEPIVPVRRSGSVDPWWLQVVEISGVDGLVNVDADPGAAEKVAERLGLPLADLVNIDRAGVTQFTVHPAAIAQLTQSPFDSVLIARSESDLWEVIATGDLTPAHQEDLKGSSLAIGRPRTTDEIGRAEFVGGTLLVPMIGRPSTPMHLADAAGLACFITTPLRPLEPFG